MSQACVENQDELHISKATIDAMKILGRTSFRVGEKLYGLEADLPTTPEELQITGRLISYDGFCMMFPKLDKRKLYIIYETLNDAKIARNMAIFEKVIKRSDISLWEIDSKGKPKMTKKDCFSK